MNRYDVKAKFHEILQTKMLHMPLTPENIHENIYNTIILHYGMFRDDLTPEIVEAIYNDPHMPPPHREYTDVIDQGMAVIEVIMNEELWGITDYLSRKFRTVLEHDYNGLKFSSITLDYKNISQLMLNEGDNLTHIAEIDYEALALDIISAEQVDAFAVDGTTVNIMYKAGLKNKFARFNLAGLDFIMTISSFEGSETDNVVRLFH